MAEVESEADDKFETIEQRRERLTPVMAQLKATSPAVFLDLCEMTLMFSEGMTGSLKWEHPTGVVVHIKHKQRPKKPG